jgi:molybdenum ABC transporter molybdate-binding protein
LTSHGFDNFYPIGKGTLVILSKKNVSNVNDLKKLKLIALPNPKTTIYGKAAKEAFDKLGRKKGFLPVALMPQGINYLLMGNCDGAVANLVQAKFHKKLHYLVIPQKYYSPIVLGFSILSDNRNAQSFLNFVKSPQAQKILKEYGL